MVETNGSVPPADGAQPPPAAPIPAHSFVINCGNDYSLGLQIQFAKSLPYEMAAAIKAGQDPYEAFTQALTCLVVVAAATPKHTGESPPDAPMVQRATTVPPVPRILRPR